MEEQADDRIAVMVTEPAFNLILEKAYELYMMENTEQKLADVFAIVGNKT